MHNANIGSLVRSGNMEDVAVVIGEYLGWDFQLILTQHVFSLRRSETANRD